MSNDGASALTMRERVGYAVGDLGINFYFITALTFLLFFYTDVFGLSPAVAASVFFVARIVDAVTDPLMGWIADRTRSRHGRFRPWLLWGALPLALITIATWTTPGLDEQGKIIWAYVTYIAFGIAYTVVGIPYSALTAALTSDYQERTRLSSIRMLFAFAGGLTASVATKPLVDMADDPATGYMWTITAYSVLATGLLWLCFANTRERPELLRAAAKPPPLSDALATVYRNPPLLAAIVIFFLGSIALTIRQSGALYYFKYYLERPDLIPWFFGLTMPLMMLGLLFVPWLSQNFGKPRSLAIGAAISAVSGIGIWFAPPDQVVLIFALFSIGAFGGAPMAAIGWAMIPDTVEYAEWKTGVRADGVIYSTASFVQKLAKAVGGMAAAIALSAAGYVANAAQSEASLATIAGLVSLGPAAVALLMVAACALYRLDEPTHRKIVAELEERAQGATA